MNLLSIALIFAASELFLSILFTLMAFYLYVYIVRVCMPAAVSTQTAGGPENLFRQDSAFFTTGSFALPLKLHSAASVLV